MTPKLPIVACIIALIILICPPQGEAQEPDCDCDATVVQQRLLGPVRGMADTHTHQFSNMAFGGALLWGKPFDERNRGISAALSGCDYTWDYALWRGDRRTWPTLRGYSVHKSLTGRLISSIMGEGWEHSAHGWPTFDAWPHWYTTMHQQMYYRWLERAYRGGLRLMVMLAVNNEVICRLYKQRYPFRNCDDMTTVDAQIRATKNLEKFIDAKSGGRGKGWYRIVKTPRQARRAIRRGKMAVVLGIEADALFGCKPESTCDDDFIRTELERYYKMGVRHLFPVHLHDNLFSGAALYYWLWPTANRIATGTNMQPVECASMEDSLELLTMADYNWNIFDDISQGAAVEDYKELLSEAEVSSPGIKWRDIDYHCNKKGLTAKGELLIQAMMDQKMIIDVDHLSLLALDKVLQIALTRDYPVISSHSFLFDRPLTEWGQYDMRSEAHRTREQIEIIRDLGGIVAPLNPRKEGSSTKDYAEMYSYVKAIMQDGPYGADYPGVAFASDWGAMFEQTAPRCPENQDCDASDEPALTYPFRAVGVGGIFGQQVTGERKFDFNRDGLAHVGLLPDFIKDLTNVGLTEAEIDPLFNSAEAYIRMWEKIQRGKPD
jgi:microsomal dipeptidase-like Zn-dependent dipeptidase